MSQMQHTCPVCAYAGLDEAHMDVLGEPTYAICPSCGTQFGADDLIYSHDELRAKWLLDGANWWSEATPAPSAWNGITQLQNAGFSTAVSPTPHA